MPYGYAGLFFFGYALPVTLVALYARPVWLW